jgi:RNase adapter protein RapZ
MKLSIVSGRSGSGKSTALKALEDVGFNCIDNFPVTLLEALVANTLKNPDQQSNYAVCIDARNPELNQFPEILARIDRSEVQIQIIYLDALTGTLVKRFSETRRRHPLTDENTDLLEAIEAERNLLQPIADIADLIMDTTTMLGTELIDAIRTRVAATRASGISILFRSFGFKLGVPVDADFVFDIRCLPNPHWRAELRPLTGRDSAVADFLAGIDQVNDMFADIAGFLERWIPQFEADNRAYMTIAVGCTGGQHRSVYMVERLGDYFQATAGRVLVRHRELPAAATT